MCRKGTSLPCTRTYTFTNDTDLDKLDVCIYQGESKFISNNSQMWKFPLVFPKLVAKGCLRVKIHLQVDKTGKLEVNLSESLHNIYEGRIGNVTTEETGDIVDDFSSLEYIIHENNHAIQQEFQMDITHLLNQVDHTISTQSHNTIQVCLLKLKKDLLQLMEDSSKALSSSHIERLQNLQSRYSLINQSKVL
jgi:molecular chaperone DnaK (HSP70)